MKELENYKEAKKKERRYEVVNKMVVHCSVTQIIMLDMFKSFLNSIN